jgi:hypothetical protein
MPFYPEPRRSRTHRLYAATAYIPPDQRELLRQIQHHIDHSLRLTLLDLGYTDDKLRNTLRKKLRKPYQRIILEE